MRKKLTYVYLDEGEFLYDSLTRRLYTVNSPHICKGYICEELKVHLKNVYLQVQ